MTVEQIVRALRSAKSDLRTHYHADIIGLFGSVVRGNDTPDSDIDILVELDSQAGLFDLVGLGIFLEELLQRQVDVVPVDSLRPELCDSVIASVIKV